MTESRSVCLLLPGFLRVGSTLAGIVLLGIAFDALIAIRLPLEWPWTLFGLVAFALGIALEAAGTRAFWTHGHGTPAPETHPERLVTRGPYAWSRHPLYLARHLMLLGLALFLASPSIVVLTVLLFILVESVLIPREEARLAARFTGPYEEYRSQVGRWITVRRRPRR
jgi:protein-S-isoprenylcysteine O-methyltransferase Ste14